MVAAWLQDHLVQAWFEPGLKIPINFVKAHLDFNNILVSAHNGPKIRIRPTFSKLSTHFYLFLVKNVYTQIPGFSRDPFDLETMTKVTRAANTWFEHDSQCDNSMYDFVLDFSDTFNTTRMIDMYQTLNGKLPTSDQIKILLETNRLNDPLLDKNHACVVSAMILQREHDLGLVEQHRFWSVPEIYKKTDVTDLYNTIYAAIVPENYNLSKIGSP